MPHSIFFSWQASRSSREGRNLIEQALKMAIDALSDDTTLEEALRDGLDLDKDTRNVPGNPPIFSTILGKIDKAAIFVPDLTSVAKREDGQLIPNPNVLIEYGWALRSLGYHRIVTVMNVAYGDPKNEPLPFDMAHLRFPITYNLPEGASDTDRRSVRSTLAQELENALRTVFNSEEFKSQLPRTPAPPEFPRQAPLDGRARFRPKGKSIGLLRDQMAGLTGEPASAELQLGEGAACWFRLMPTVDTGRRWTVLDLKDKSLRLAAAPILHTGQFGGFVRGADGAGHFSIEGGDTTRALSYVFKTGEIWMIDSWLAQVRYVELDESAFIRTLSLCSTFLADQLGLEGPYHWETGFEGIAGRMLAVPNRYSRGAGTAIEDLVEDSGIFNQGDDPAEALRLFFEKVFDCFGLGR
jgi:hypothetical protein